MEEIGKLGCYTAERRRGPSLESCCKLASPVISGVSLGKLFNIMILTLLFGKRSGDED